MSYTVSYFNNADDTTPKNYSLFEWLENTINPPEHLKRLVIGYRDTMLRKDKIKIPCITISATFHTKRNLDNIQEKNGLICIDIDRFAKKKTTPSNPCLDMTLAKELISSHPCCLYVGESCSGGGDGMYAIFKIAHSDRLEDYFEYFKKTLAIKGINIDGSCKDYSRCRFFSIDPEAYFYPDCKVFKLKEQQVCDEKPTTPIRTYQPTNIIDSIGRAHSVIQQAVNSGIDLTSSYDDWIKIGAALYNEFREEGRGLFHLVSSVNSEYKVSDCDKKYDQCSRMNKTNISSLYYIASSYGIRY